MLASVCRQGFLSLLILIATFGCSRTSSKTQAPIRTETDVLPDRSLALEEYIRAGIPAANKPWSAIEMSAAATALSALAEKDPNTLPRYESDRSGPLFARITSADNLAYFRDRSIPLDQRFPGGGEFFLALHNIFKLYSNAFLHHAISDSEIVEIMGTEFRATVVIIELYKEFVPTLSRNDPKYMNRMAGVAKVKLGMTTMVIGALQTLAETRNLRPTQMKRLLTYMQETFPLIISELVPGPASEILARIKSMSTDPIMLEVQPGLQELHERVAAAIAKAEQSPEEQVGLRPEDLQKKGVILHRVQAGEPDKTGWCLAQSTGGGFSVSLPGRFNDFSQNIKAEEGVTISSHTVGMTTLLGVKFTAMVMSRSDGKFKTNSVEDLADGFKKEGNQVEKRSVKIAGYAGIEFSVKGKDSSAIFRVFKTRTSVYQMIVEYPPFLKEQAVDAKRFFESFTLAEKSEN
jgi:hypothetical protein